MKLRQKHFAYLRHLLLMGLGTVLIVLIFPAPVLALDTRSGPDVRIGPDETINDDLVIAANRFTLEGTVNGDLMVLAEEITIRGTVNGDVQVLGREVIINGVISENARVGGRTLQLGPASRIGRHVLAAAGRLEIVRGAEIAGTLSFTGLQARINGQIGGSSNPVERTSQLHGMSLIAMPGSTSAAQITTGPDGLLVLFHLRRATSLLLIGLMLLWLWPSLLRTSARRLQERPVAGLLWGFVAIPALLVAALVVSIATGLLSWAFSMLGLGDLFSLVLSSGILAVAGLAVVAAVLLSYVGYLVTAMTIGNLLLGWIPAGRVYQPFLALLVGTILYVAVTAIPQVGPVLSLLALLFGLGGLWLRWRPQPVVRTEASTAAAAA